MVLAGVGCRLHVLLFLLLLVMWEGEARRKSTQRKAQHCHQGTHTCHKDALCVSTRRSFRCKCQPGYNGDGKVCKDADECAHDNGGCVHLCQNTPGNFTCSCKPGFVLAPDGRDCLDRNECFHRKGGCPQQCVNTLGSFECKCNSGYSLDSSGTRCVFGEWCRIKFGCEHGCKPSSAGNQVECYCRDGYHLHQDGKTCRRGCLLGNGGCQHTCHESASGPVCSCAPNYLLNVDGQTCTASCSVNNGGCERKCMDSENGPECSCPSGFKLHQDGRSCLDVNECDLQTDGCSHQCDNTRGSFECVCPPGYKVGLDYKTCIDIDECILNSTCDQSCENTPGSFVCHCREGYQKYGITHCAEVDECSIRNGGCAHTCQDNPDGYSCSCAEGFKLHPNLHDCIDSAQCTPLAPHHGSELSCDTAWFPGQSCQLGCPAPKRLVDTQTGLLNTSTLRFTCGRSTSYEWTNLGNASLPKCSGSLQAPSYARSAKFVFVHESCGVDPRAVEVMRQNLTLILNNEKKYKCSKRCQINYLELNCGSKRKKFRKLIRRNKKSLITAEFELQINPRKETGNKCNVECAAQRTAQRFNQAFKKMRRAIKRQKLVLRLGESEVKPIKKSLKYDKHYRELCMHGMQLLNNICVGCTVGTFYNTETKTCDLCPRGTYQDEEARVNCLECPDRLPGSGVEGATSRTQCSELCEPGTYSASGKKPCQPCGLGTYQPHYGRISCIQCGRSLQTSQVGSDGFEDCLVPVHCDPGNYHNLTTQTCSPCQKGFYQPKFGQDFCFPCPGRTSTDFPGSVSEEDCKDRRCGRHMEDFFGVLESPNYPGNYPVGVECVWKIRPEKRRRILIIIPQIELSDRDKCGDIIIMRKSKSVYSQSTFETCESRDRPIAFTARSKKLWIQFKSDGNNTAGGFSIPFVTYSEEYESLIEDIVRDGRLYSSKQHQQIFKDQQLLTSMLEVIATPYNYLKYANISHTMFPQSFFRLLTPKIRRFFQT